MIFTGLTREKLNLSPQIRGNKILLYYECLSDGLKQAKHENEHIISVFKIKAHNMSLNSFKIQTATLILN